MGQSILLHHRVIAIIAIRLKSPLVVFEQALGDLSSSTRIIVIQNNPLIRWTTPL